MKNKLIIPLVLLLLFTGILFFQINNLDTINTFSISIFAENNSIQELAFRTKENCDDTNRPKELAKLTCYAKEFEKIALENNPDFAFEVLNALQKLDETAQVCHFIAHGIGWGTYDSDPDDWQNQIASIKATCVYGGLHGILEQYIYNLPGGKLTKDVMIDICEFNPSPGCLHGVGHLTVVEVQDNLDKAIELCSAFPTDKRQRHYCLTGVFMEHMIADNLVQHGVYPQSRRTNWWKLIDEFEELCRSYKGENATACWSEMIHPSSIKFKGNPEQMFDFCDTAQVEEGVKSCKRHAITEILAKNQYNISSLKYMCSIEQINDSSFERDCYANMASLKLFHSSPKEVGDVIDFCSSLDPEFQSSCFSQMRRTLKQISPNSEEIVEVCENAPTEFRSKCMGR